jgi:hypothetical protein
MSCKTSLDDSTAATNMSPVCALIAQENIQAVLAHLSPYQVAEFAEKLAQAAFEHARPRPAESGEKKFAPVKAIPRWGSEENPIPNELRVGVPQGIKSDAFYFIRDSYHRKPGVSRILDVLDWDVSLAEVMAHRDRQLTEIDTALQRAKTFQDKANEPIRRNRALYDDMMSLLSYVGLGKNRREWYQKVKGSSVWHVKEEPEPWEKAFVQAVGQVGEYPLSMFVKFPLDLKKDIEREFEESFPQYRTRRHGRLVEMSLGEYSPPPRKTIPPFDDVTRALGSAAATNFFVHYYQRVLGFDERTAQELVRKKKEELAQGKVSTKMASRLGVPADLEVMTKAFAEIEAALPKMVAYEEELNRDRNEYQRKRDEERAYLTGLSLEELEDVYAQRKVAAAPPEAIPAPDGTSFYAEMSARAKPAPPVVAPSPPDPPHYQALSNAGIDPKAAPPKYRRDYAELRREIDFAEATKIAKQEYDDDLRPMPHPTLGDVPMSPFTTKQQYSDKPTPLKQHPLLISDVLWARRYSDKYRAQIYADNPDYHPEGVYRINYWVVKAVLSETNNPQAAHDDMTRTLEAYIQPIERELALVRQANKGKALALTERLRAYFGQSLPSGIENRIAQHYGREDVIETVASMRKNLAEELEGELKRRARAERDAKLWQSG